MKKAMYCLKMSPWIHLTAVHARWRLVHSFASALESCHTWSRINTRSSVAIRKVHLYRTGSNCNRYRSSTVIQNFDEKPISRTHQTISTNIGTRTSSQDDVQLAVDNLLVEASDKDKMVLSLPKRKILKDVEGLLQTGFTLSNLGVLSAYPGILGNIPRLTELVQAMIEIGLSCDDVSIIVKQYPAILNCDKEEFGSTVHTLQSQGFSVDLISQMIIQQPQILHEDLGQIELRIKELKLLFKTKDTFRLLSKSPSLLFCEFSEIQEKFDYVYHIMGVTQPQMMYSRLFSYPIEHVHARHMFVVRAGFFKKVKRKEGQIDHNPKLDTVLDTSDAQFAKKFGDMSESDYQTFKKLLMKERVYTKVVTEFDD